MKYVVKTFDELLNTPGVKKHNDGFRYYGDCEEESFTSEMMKWCGREIELPFELKTEKEALVGLRPVDWRFGLWMLKTKQNNFNSLYDKLSK